MPPKAEPNRHRSNTHPQPPRSSPQIFRETAPPKAHSKAEPHKCDRQTKPEPCPDVSEKKTPSLHKIISSSLPGSVYNRETGKIFGLLSAEDLLLVALILLFAENEENNDDPLIILALIYILISEYIDLPDFLI